MKAEFKLIGDAASWLWKNAIKPAWDGIKTAIGDAWTAIKREYLDDIHPAVVAVASVFVWLKGEIHQAWLLIKQSVSEAWTDIKAKFEEMKPALKVLGDAFTALLNNVIKPVWDGIKLAIKGSWDSIKTNFQEFKDGMHLVGDTVGWLWKTIVVPSWEGIRLAIQSAWDNINTTFDHMKTGTSVLADKFTWFKDTIIKPVWDAIKVIISTVWDSGIKPIFENIKGGVKLMADNMKWFKDEVIKPVWDGIKLAISLAWVAIQLVFKTIEIALRLLGAAFKALYDNFIKPVWDAIKTALKAAWDWIYKNVFKPIIDHLKGPLGAAWTWVKDHITTVWNSIKGPLKAVWDWIYKNVLTPMGHFITKDLPGFFSKGIDFIKAAWEGLKTVVSKPVEFVVNTIIRDGIVAGFNKIAESVGVTPIKFAGMSTSSGKSSSFVYQSGNAGAFNTGGVMPGYTPGRDVHRFVGAAGTLDLSGGEAVMRPEWTRVMGKGFVDKMNAAARTGGTSGVKSAMGLADGGVIPHQAFKSGGLLGGWWEDLSGMAKSAASVIGEYVGQVKNSKAGTFLTTLLKHTVSTIMTNVKDRVFAGHTGGGGSPSTKELGNVGAGTGWAWEESVLRKQFPSVQFYSTTGGGHAKNSWHYKGRALDLTPSMEIFNWIKKNYGSRTLELIYGPAGGGTIKDGKPHHYSPMLMAAHYNHIHWAINKGGVLGDAFKYDDGGWLQPGTTGVNTGKRPEAVLTPEESTGLKAMSVDKLADLLEELIDAVHGVAPGVGGYIRGSGTGLRTQGRRV